MSAFGWLERQPKIERGLFRRHLEEGSLVLCDLARRGHSTDKKNGKLQIVFALLCNRDGCPAAVEVFEGTAADPAAPPIPPR